MQCQAPEGWPHSDVTEFLSQFKQKLLQLPSTRASAAAAHRAPSVSSVTAPKLRRTHLRIEVGRWSSALSVWRRAEKALRKTTESQRLCPFCARARVVADSWFFQKQSQKKKQTFLVVFFL